MEDKQIIALYFARSESAIAETDKKYGRYCHYIAYQILDSNEDAEEIVNDTWLRTWNTIPPQRPEPLKAYVGRISSNLALDRYDERHAAKRGGGQLPAVLDELAECIPDHADGGDMGESIALRDALNRFLSSLPRKTRNVFVRRYWYAAPIAEIAREFAMKESTVAMLLLRTRNKLKEFLSKEGFDV